MDWNQYVGLPFQERGRSWEGVDCYGIIYLFYRENWGIDLPWETGYHGVEDTRSITELVNDEAQRWHRVPQGSERMGDVVLLRSTETGKHMGLVVTRGKMLHASRMAEATVVERYNTSTRKARIEGFYRHEQMA